MTNQEIAKELREWVMGTGYPTTDDAWRKICEYREDGWYLDADIDTRRMFALFVAEAIESEA